MEPTILGEDNMSMIAIINNDSNSNKIKHIEIRFNLIEEQVLKMIIELQHLATEEMTSDVLTKALDRRLLLIFVLSYLTCWLCVIHIAVQGVYRLHHSR